MKKYRLNENQYKIYENFILNENQESDSQKKAIEFVKEYADYPQDDANVFVRKRLRMILNVLNANKKAGKFTLGCARILFEDDLIGDDNGTGEIPHEYNNCQKKVNILNKIVRYICSNEETYKKFDKNLNGWNYAKLSYEYRKVHFDVKNESDKVDGKSRYKIYKINDFQHAWTFHEFVSWCITRNESSYDDYTNGGTNQFYFCIRDDFQYVKPEKGINSPLDDYGLSMFAVCVDDDGDLETCTCRWNHDNGGDDHCMTITQIEDVLNLNFYKTFKPKYNESNKDFYKHIKDDFENVSTVGDLTDLEEETNNNSIFSIDYSNSKYGIYTVNLRDFSYIFADLDYEDVDYSNVDNWYESIKRHNCRKIKTINSSGGCYTNGNYIIYGNLDNHWDICDRYGRDVDTEFARDLKENFKNRKVLYTHEIFVNFHSINKEDNTNLIHIDNKLYNINGDLLLEIDNEINGEKCSIIYSTPILNASYEHSKEKPYLLCILLRNNGKTLKRIYYDVVKNKEILSYDKTPEGISCNAIVYNKDLSVIWNSMNECDVYYKGEIKHYKGFLTNENHRDFLGNEQRRHLRFLYCCAYNSKSDVLLVILDKFRKDAKLFISKDIPLDSCFKPKFSEDGNSVQLKNSEDKVITIN